MATPACSSSFSFSYGWSYEVFLSFRGPDTRYGFTGTLYEALQRRGIQTFFDDGKLQQGNQITTSLVKAIQASKIAVVVLSKDYASSSFCLEELVNIVDCSKEKGTLVLPVFYDVNPSDVRHLKGSYGEALAKHKDKYKVNEETLEKWKMALKEVADFSGWHFKHGDGYEYKFIDSIVEVVANKINRAPLYVARHPVGLESRVLQVKSLLYGGSDDGVCIVGIHGLGGMGKTTIARALYNSIFYQFSGLCFLEDVRRKELVYLQETLLSKIVGDKDIKLGSINEGISIIQHRLKQKKVLLVLDDVDELEQLQAIVGEPNWFGSGSKLIITTRDKRLLTSHGIKKIYEVHGLNEEEGLELLHRNAFKTSKVDERYNDILSRALTYASGLPLALEVIGSYLSGQSIENWASALDEYERFPNKKIQDILKVSFESLGEYEKKIFLDIACCFRRYSLAYVKKILHAHHRVRPENGIQVLIEKSLIRIDWSYCLTLHDLIEDMGKDIVRQESPDEPGKRSRLWFTEDILQVLEENTGTSTIQIIILDFLKFKKINWDGEAFKEMKNLKTLIIRTGCFSTDPKYLPKSLRVLEWWRYPSSSLPSNFYPKDLVILELPQSCIMSLELAMSKKKFMNLRDLNFDHCQLLSEIPDISNVPNLEKLSFRYCENLIKIHESVGSRAKLRILDARCCDKLRTFPPIKLKSLEQLELSGCSSLENFPEILEKMENVTSLYIRGIAINEFPSSIKNLTRARSLELHHCGSLTDVSTLVMLPDLRWLNVWQCEGLQSYEKDNGKEKVSSILSSNMEYVYFKNCNLSDEFLRRGLPWFAYVKSLDLSCNNFTILPACIEECRLLRELKLKYCKLLRETKGIPSNLEKFTLQGCTSLTKLDLTVLPACTKECHLRELLLDGCVNLKEITGVLSNIEYMSTEHCYSLNYLRFRSMSLSQE